MSFAHAAMTHQTCCRWTLLRSIIADRWTAARGLSCCRCYNPSNKSTTGFWDRWYNELHALHPRTLLGSIKSASTHAAMIHQLDPSNAWLSIPPSHRSRLVARSSSSVPRRQKHTEEASEIAACLSTSPAVYPQCGPSLCFPFFWLKKERLATIYPWMHAFILHHDHEHSVG